MATYSIHLVQLNAACAVLYQDVGDSQELCCVMHGVPLACVMHGVPLACKQLLVCECSRNNGRDSAAVIALLGQQQLLGLL